MKKILIIACLFLSINLFSQGNLQFSQVLLFSADNYGNQLTVPTGKVWKIESYISTGNGLSLIFNNVVYGANAVFPFWVPSGTTFFIKSTGSSGAVMVSIIEFNVVP